MDASCCGGRPLLAARTVVAVYAIGLGCLVFAARKRHPDRQADRQAGRQTDRQTGRQADRQTDRPTDRQTDRRSC